MLTKTCSIEGCDNKNRARGYCVKHYNKWRRYGNPLFGIEYNKDLKPDKFRTVFYKDRWIAEHNMVMEQILGRNLLPHESVYHKNGQLYDNSPDNLELWTTWQPEGSRVEDKIQWANEILAQYG